MSRTALVVEDDFVLAELISEVISRMGFIVTTMHQGMSAVQWVRDHQPAVVLLDVMLPDISGYDVCKSLKLDRQTNLIPIILSTARTLHEDQAQGLSVGANFYLAKPFTIDQLERAVQTALTWREDVERSGADGEVHFQLKSELHYLKELNHLLSSLYLFSGFNEDQSQQLAMAVHEMGTNAIEWGNRKCADQPVTVTYRIDPEKVTIIIRDAGPGFDRDQLSHVAKLTDPTSHLEVRESMGIRTGGFGILMTKGLVDEMNYNEAGNEVRLIKRFSPNKQTVPT